MLSKIVATALTLAMAQKGVQADGHENMEMDVMNMEGEMAENLPPPPESMEGEEMGLTTTMAPEDGEHEGHDHEDHMHTDVDGEPFLYPIPESCLSKSFTIGTVEGVDSVTMFDNTEEILLRMDDHHHAHSLEICTQPETGYIHSLALEFRYHKDMEGEEN